MARSSTRKMRSKRGKKSRSSRGKMSRSKRMRFYGGANMFPAGVSDNSMLEASKMSLAQGRDYLSHHTAQHGGMAPVGYTGVLDDSLRATARVGVLDESMGAIQGMKDQSGGGKRKRMTMKMAMKKMRKMMGLKGGKMMYGGKKMMGGKMMYGGKKGMTMKMMKKMMKKRGTRRMRGGFAYALSQAQDYSAPGMLLSPAGEARALAGMNPEWKLATDPSAFAPKMM
jgi:hypothetical protein